MLRSDFRFRRVGRDKVAGEAVDPSAVHAQEPKTKVVPSGMLLALLDPARLWEPSDVVAFSMGELVRWLSKPLEPLVTQTHEPKTKVAP